MNSLMLIIIVPWFSDLVILQRPHFFSGTAGAFLHQGSHLRVKGWNFLGRAPTEQADLTSRSKIRSTSEVVASLMPNAAARPLTGTGCCLDVPKSRTQADRPFLSLPPKRVNSLFYYFCCCVPMFSCRSACLHRCCWICSPSLCSGLCRINLIQSAGAACQYHNCIIFSCSSSQCHSARLSSEC